MRVLETRHNPIEICNYGVGLTHPKLENIYNSPALRLVAPTQIDPLPEFRMKIPTIFTVPEFAAEAKAYLGDEELKVDIEALFMEKQRTWHFWRLRAHPAMIEMHFAEKRQREKLSGTLLVDANPSLVTGIVVKLGLAPWLQLDIVKERNITEDQNVYHMKTGCIADEMMQPNPTHRFLEIRKVDGNNSEVKSIKTAEQLVG